MVVHDGRTSTEHRHKHGADKGKGKETENTKEKIFSFLHRASTKKEKKPLNPNPAVSPDEADKETSDLNKVLEDLNLSAINNRAFSISAESQVLVQKFTLVLKDLINGVPTAYDDLTHLLDDSQGTLAKSYDHLPSFLQKLIQQLPEKMKGSLGPEILAVAAEAQALGGGKGGSKGKVGNMMALKDMVTKPGAVVGLLKTIMNFLKLRFPAFMGTNVLLSLGLFVLLFVFWYCHKRGREVRLEKENRVDSQGRIIELPDDPLIGPSSPHSRHHDREGSHRHRSSRSGSDVEGERVKMRRRDTDPGLSGGVRRTSSSLEREELRLRGEEKERRRKRRELERERGERPSSSRHHSDDASGTHRRRKRSDEYVSSGSDKRDRRDRERERERR
jgi:hypothetical protein